MVAISDVKRHANKVLRRLRLDYPDSGCSLTHKTPLQLLISTMLSAQCTDKQVNRVTPKLFKKYPKTADFATVRLSQLERDIKSTGFYRNKAKNIKACCQQLMELHDGQVPDDLDSLVELAGVGRKTANAVLGSAFGIASGVVVDTHVGRITRRLGMTKEKDPVKVERDLNQQLPRTQWISFTHRMIDHGRQVCSARKPRCEQCSMKRFCPRIGVS